MSGWPLLGLVVVLVGWRLRLQPVLVVAAAAATTVFLATRGLVAGLEQLGEAFLQSRTLGLFVLTLPAVAVLESAGLRTRVQGLFARLKSATPGRLLFAYLVVRQATAGLGIFGAFGHAQSVRPLLSPMVEAAAEKRRGSLTDEVKERLRALAAATDNVGLFFGEDLFVAFGAVLLMQSFYASQGVDLSAVALSLWGLPTALFALLIHGGRVLALDRSRLLAPPPSPESP